MTRPRPDLDEEYAAILLEAEQVDLQHNLGETVNDLVIRAADNGINRMAASAMSVVMGGGRKQ